MITRKEVYEALHHTADEDLLTQINTFRLSLNKNPICPDTLEVAREIAQDRPDYIGYCAELVVNQP